MAGLLFRVSNRTETLNQVWCHLFSFWVGYLRIRLVDDPIFQAADTTRSTGAGYAVTYMYCWRPESVKLEASCLSTKLGLNKPPNLMNINR
jgi:hypothetical protein